MTTSIIGIKPANPLLGGHPNIPLNLPFIKGSGSVVKDLSGDNNHGTITGAVWATTANGWMLHFVNDGDRVDCGNDSSLNITDTCSVEMILNADIINDETHRLLHKNSSYTFMINEADSRLYTYNYGGPKHSRSDIDSISALTVLYVVFTKSSTNGTSFYVNGVQKGIDASAGAKGSYPVTVNDLLLGVDEDLSSFQYKGYMCCLRVRDKEMSEDDVTYSYLDLRRRLRI